MREDSLPAELEVTGRTASGIVMALRHRDLPLEGVQFHPESVLTEGGHRLLATWLVTCGRPGAARTVSVRGPTGSSRRWPEGPQGRVVEVIGGAAAAEGAVGAVGAVVVEVGGVVGGR